MFQNARLDRLFAGAGGRRSGEREKAHREKRSDALPSGHFLVPN